jgi:hypothetical protein
MAYGQNAPFGLQPRTYLTGAPWNQQNRTYRINPLTANNPIFLGDPVTLLDDGTIGAVPPFQPNPPAGGNTPWVGVFQGVQYYNPNNGNQFQFAKYWPGGPITQPPGFYPMALVADDPTIIFSIQASTSLAVNGPPENLSTAIGVALNQLFLNASVGLGFTPSAGPPPAQTFATYNSSATTTVTPLANPLSGSTASGQSAYYLDVNQVVGAPIQFATPGTNATLPLKILDLESSVIPTQAFYSNNGGILTGVFNNVLVLINNHYYKGGTGTVGI